MPGRAAPFGTAQAILDFYDEAVHTAGEVLSGAVRADPERPADEWATTPLDVAVAARELAESGALWNLTEADVARVFGLRRSVATTTAHERGAYQPRPEALGAWLLVVMARRRASESNEPIPKDDDDAVRDLDHAADSMKRWLRRVRAAGRRATP